MAETGVTLDNAVGNALAGFWMAAVALAASWLLDAPQVVLWTAVGALVMAPLIGATLGPRRRLVLVEGVLTEVTRRRTREVAVAQAHFGYEWVPYGAGVLSIAAASTTILVPITDSTKQLRVAIGLDVRAKHAPRLLGDWRVREALGLGVD